MKTYHELATKRGYLCECGCGLPSSDRHHCLIPHLKRGGEILNDERNLVLVNHHEHVDLKKFDNLEWRRRFWKLQCRRYGEAAMLEWVNALPEKMKKTRLDFLTLF